jgi:Cns1/TTC4 Wheel domain
MEPVNKEMISMKDQCRVELTKIRKIETEKAKKKQALRTELAAVYDLAAANGVKLKAPSHPLPPQLTMRSPHCIPGDEGVYWSLLLLYPQYNKIDVVQSVLQSDMIAIYLADVLPEESSPSWDKQNEYHVSSLCVYIRTDTDDTASTSSEWIDGCENILSGAREEVEDNAYLVKYRRSSTKKVCWLDVHLGVSILTLLRTGSHVIYGGVLHMIVFPRNNAAHLKFITDAKADGELFGHIDPNGVVTV